jgi:hypothetical protein
MLIFLLSLWPSVCSASESPNNNAAGNPQVSIFSTGSDADSNSSMFKIEAVSPDGTFANFNEPVQLWIDGQKQPTTVNVQNNEGRVSLHNDSHALSMAITTNNSKPANSQYSQFTLSAAKPSSIAPQSLNGLISSSYSCPAMLTLPSIVC